MQLSLQAVHKSARVDAAGAMYNVCNACKWAAHCSVGSVQVYKSARVQEWMRQVQVRRQGREIGLVVKGGRIIAAQITLIIN